MLGSPKVHQVWHLRTQHFGPEQLQVEPRLGSTVPRLCQALTDTANDLGRRVREAVPIAYPMYIQPAIEHDSASEEAEEPL